jgi:uncharacterized membrane protein
MQDVNEKIAEDELLEIEEVDDIHHARLAGVDEETHQAWQEEFETWEEVEDTDISFADRCSDNISNFVGSWTFVITFIIGMGLWMAYNTLTYFSHFDVYPFILLNLALSTIAAIQAPLIMMAQRRQDDRDRSRAKLDFELSRKAECEIKSLRAAFNAQAQQNQLLLNEIRSIRRKLDQS